MTLKSFPRGGKKPVAKPNNSGLLFNKKESGKTKKNRGRKDQDAEQLREEKSYVAKTAESLTYSAIMEGMVLLGRVHNVTEYDMIVALPGRLSGRLQVTDISKTYTSLLQTIVKSEDSQPTEFKPLSELYAPGDYVTCSVKSLSTTEKWRISLSLEPELINKNLDPAGLSKGSKMVGSVSSVEDHGYVVDTGIDNLRCFLGVKDIDSDVQYYPGKQVFCAVKRVKTLENSTTAELLTKSKHVSSPTTEDRQSLDALIPGTKFVLLVQNVLSNGLQVSFNSGNVGYVNRMYLDNPLDAYEPGQEIIGTLMYVMPTVKFAYFTLLPSHDEKERLSIGETFDNAKVLYTGNGGVVMSLKKGIRGLVPYRRTEIDYEKIPEIFLPRSTHKCRVLAYDSIERIYVCTMERELLKQKHLSNETLAPGEVLDVQIARVQPQTGYVMVTAGKARGWVAPEHVLDVGSTKRSAPKVGDVVRARVLGRDMKQNGTLFTLKKSLIESTLPVLSDINEAKVGSEHHGTIVQINRKGLLVSFFDRVKGWVPSSSLDSKAASTRWNFVVGQTIVARIERVNVRENKIDLSVFNSKRIEEKSFEIGEAVEGTVVESSIDGVYVRLTKDDQNPKTAFLPAGHIAPCEEVASYLSARYVVGDSISALVFSTSPRFVLTRTFVPHEKYRDFKTLRIGDCLPCSISELGAEGSKLILPIKNFDSYGILPANAVDNVDALHVNQLLFARVTSIDKSRKKITLTTALREVWNESSKSDDDLVPALDVTTLHFNKLRELSEHDYYKNKPISRAKIGARVSGVVDKVTEHGLVLKLENELVGTVRRDHYKGDLKAGDKINGSILWINYIHELVEVTLLPRLVNIISTKQTKLANVTLDTQLRGDIVLVTNWFALVVLKGAGNGNLAALPTRRHINDVEPDLTPYAIGKRIRCYVVLNKSQSDLLPICLVKSSFEVSKSVELPLEKHVKKELKRKSESTTDEILSRKIMKTKEASEVPEVEECTKKKKKKKAVKVEAVKTKEEPDVSTIAIEETSKRKKFKRARTVVEEDTAEPEVEECAKKNKNKKVVKKSGKTEEVHEVSTIASEERTKRKKLKRTRTEVEEDIAEPEVTIGTLLESNEDFSESDEGETKDRLGIPECGFFWDNKPDESVRQPEEESSSDDDDDEADEETSKRKKKKLNAAERREAERQKEREIREREEALASNEAPNSVDQFDRLVLSSPDSSMIWLQYMAYHLQATEIEKARAVAKRAIKTINFREESERLNVWQAWLNLESRFGSSESLESVFQEAVKTNDALKVHLHMLTVHADAGRRSDLEKIVTTIVGKFKQVAQVWIECGCALLKIGLKDKSRHIMQRALQSLPPQEHVNLMVKFAQMENKFGDKERAQTLFEQILSSYPKRVDVWSSYVDALVKSGDLDVARKVLERSVVQTLPARKMKTLFKKFIAFEEAHGSPEGVSHVQQLALKYVENQCGK